MKIEHIGIAVNNLETSNLLFEKLFGNPPYKQEEVISEGVKTSFFMNGPNKIELLEATNPESPIAKFIEKKGEGIHQLRHTFASTCIMLNQNPKMIQEWLGHESILETMDTYGHLFPGELNSLRDRFDEYVKTTLEQPLKQKLLA
jgi:methylmalonyl-CoA epimerase